MNKQETPLERIERCLLEDFKQNPDVLIHVCDIVRPYSTDLEGRGLKMRTNLNPIVIDKFIANGKLQYKETNWMGVKVYTISP